MSIRTYILRSNTIKFGYCGVLVSAIFCLFLIGCAKKTQQGRFSNEELKNLPIPQRHDLPTPTGGLVLSVNRETLSAEQIITPSTQAMISLKGKSYQEFFETAMPQVKQLLKDRVTTILLYQKAKVKIPESVFEEGGPIDKAVDKEINRFIAGFGGDHSKAQKAIEKNGFNWESFREFKRKMLITQSFFSEELGETKPVSHTQLVELYNQLKDEYFKIDQKKLFQLIDIKYIKDSEEQSSIPTTKQDAQNLADKVWIEANSEKDFTEVVKKYSMGPKAQLGGEWSTTGKNTLAAPYDKVEKELDKMKPGQISGVIESGNHFFIAKLINAQKEGYIPFEEVQAKIEKRFKEIQYQQQVDELLLKMLKQANIGGIESFLDYCLKQTFIRINS